MAYQEASMRWMGYPANEKGRDFVCGDLHGAYQRFQEMLVGLEFDFERDRMFSVGDLVDRGPESVECLRPLYEPWFHAVKGNHEQMMYDNLFDVGFSGPFWMRNGGDWIHDYTVSTDVLEIRSLAKIAGELPVVMTVQLGGGKQFHVIHAEFYIKDKQPLTDDSLHDNRRFHRSVATVGNDGESAIWGRYLFGPLYKEELTPHRVKKWNRNPLLQKMLPLISEGLSPVYSGHTILTQPVTIGPLTNIDTCAYMSLQSAEKYPWAGLTVVEPATGKYWIANSKGVNETTPVVLGLQEKE